MTKTTNGGGESDKVVAKDAVKAEGTDKVVNSEPKTEPKETLDAKDLLKSKAENKPTVTDEDRQQDRKQERVVFQNAVNIHMKTIEKLMSDGVEQEDALQKVPENFRTHINKALSGETVEPKEEGSKVNPEQMVEKKYLEMRDQEEGELLFTKVVSENKLSKADTQAFAKDVMRRKELGNSLNESILDASARLGFSSKSALQQAEEKGLLRGLRAAPPEGEPIKKTDKDVTYTSEQSAMAKRFGNDPKEVYSGK